jgi:leucyl-tRNA---protein transferase
MQRCGHSAALVCAPKHAATFPRETHLARVLKVLREPPGPCSYLPGAHAALVHQIMLDVAPSEYEELMARGVRRFGPDYFAPVCEPCQACEPTRVPIATFALSRSQRRVHKNGARFREQWDVPRVDDLRLELYHKWHQGRETQRGWNEHELGARDYEMQFAFPHPSARELTLYDGEQLILVSLYDETPNALSAVYCFHDPEYAAFSLGTLNVLRLLDRAKMSTKTYLYLGYFVAQCGSLKYKGAFQPQERLLERPSSEASPRWQLSPASGNVVDGR